MASSPGALVARVLDRFLPAEAPRRARAPEPLTAVDLLYTDAGFPLVMRCDIMGYRTDPTSRTASIDLSDPRINTLTYAVGQTTITLNRLPLAIARQFPREGVLRVTIEIVGE
jgi:hypothetical protein